MVRHTTGMAGYARSAWTSAWRRRPIRTSRPRSVRADIVPLIEHYLARQRPGLRFTPEACSKLCNYSWPGNVRELRNVVVRAAVLAAGDEIGIDDLPEEFHQNAFTGDLHALAALPEMERTVIAKVLQETRGHQPSAAAKLGIS